MLIAWGPGLKSPVKINVVLVFAAANVTGGVNHSGIVVAAAATRGVGRMFDLFGAEMPLAVRFFLAFLIVLGLIGAAAWAVRRFGSARFAGTVRGRQPRLAVIEYATVDARRRLLLVRRDNIEHLMMIGGPTDVVVEANIVRAAPAALPPRMGATAENLARAIPLPEANSNGSWPLQPEAPALPVQPPAPLRRATRIEPLPEEQINVAPAHAEPIPRPQREALSALADDLAAVVHPVAPVAPITPLPPRSRPPAPARMQPAEARAETRELRMEPPRAQAAPPALDPSAADQSLAEMAQRLEAALRKPKAPDLRATPTPADDDEAEPTEEQVAAPPPAPRAARPTEAKPVRTEATPKEGKALYDSLEQEMASLLGRPPSKT
jgi:flagellar protein FliO/FliZ